MTAAVETMQAAGRNSAGPISRIVYLLASAPMERDIKRYGISLMGEKGIGVTVLDVAEICHPGVKQLRSTLILGPNIELRAVETRNDLERERQTLADADLVMCFITTGLVTRTNLPVLRMVSQTKTPYVIQRVDSLPGINAFRGDIRLFRQRLRYNITRIGNLDYLNSLIARMPNLLLGLRAPDYVVYGGLRSHIDYPLITPESKPIFGHAQDYDTYLEHNSQPGAKSDTAVFIDQFLPHHRDWQMIPGNTPIDADAYYAGLQRLFGRLEDELDLRVVIAAHPRADYSDMTGVFGDREVIFGETIGLVDQCRLAMTFTSLAINFAILFRKPMLILGDQSVYTNPINRRWIDPMVEETGAPMVFLEDVPDMDLSRILTINEGLYDRYMTEYLKRPGTPERPLWDIVLDDIEESIGVAETS